LNVYKCAWRRSALLVALIVLFASPVRGATVSLLHCWEEHRGQWLQEMLDEFERAHPGIEVDNQFFAGCGLVEQQYIIRLAAGVAPDVAMLMTNTVGALALEGSLLPLDDLMARDGIGYDTFYPSEIAAGQWNGVTYSLPIRTGGDVNNILFYNKSLFDEAGLDRNRPPETLSDLLDYAEKLVRYEGEQLVRNPVNAPSTGGGSFGHLAWLYTGGGKYLTDDARRVAFNSPEAIETIEFILDFESSVYRGEPPRWNLETNRANFLNGSLAMWIEATWEYSWIVGNRPDLELGVGVRPTKTGSEPTGIHLGTWTYGISIGTEVPNEAWELLKWLTVRPESAGAFMLRQGRASPIVAVNESEAFRAAVPWADVLGRALSTAAFSPVLPIDGDVRGVFDRFWGRAVRGEEPAVSAMEEAARLAQAELDRFWARFEN